MPFLFVKINLGMGLDQSGGVTGFTAAGWTAWVALLAFMGSAAARRVPALFAYRNLIDIATLVMVVVTLVWAWFFNPVAAEIQALQQGLGGLATGRRLLPDVATIYPHVGMALFVLAGAVLLLARRKA